MKGRIAPVCNFYSRHDLDARRPSEIIVNLSICMCKNDHARTVQRRCNSRVLTAVPQLVPCVTGALRGEDIRHPSPAQPGVRGSQSSLSMMTWTNIALDNTLDNT